MLDFGLEVLPPQPAELRAAQAARHARAPRRRRDRAALEPRADLQPERGARARRATAAWSPPPAAKRALCLDSLPEVKRALAGHYAAVARQRISDEPQPPFGDMRRRGKERVFIALPVFADGEVIAVVRASRDRSRCALVAVGEPARLRDLVRARCRSFSFGVSLAFSAAIARAAAAADARGAQRRSAAAAASASSRPALPPPRSRCSARCCSR